MFFLKYLITKFLKKKSINLIFYIEFKKIIYI